MSERFQLHNDTRIRAISLWQPWASLVALGVKRYETRSWRMKHRGPLAIHATKSWNREVLRWLLRSGDEDAERIMEMLAANGILALDDLPLGAVLCVTRAIDCVPVESIRDGLSPLERAAGDYSDGRWATELEVTEVYDPPIPARGRQGLWTWQPKRGRTIEN